MELIEARIMSEYHQPYSEIQNIPLEQMLFMLELKNAETKYIKSEQEKAHNKVKRMRR